MAINEPSTFIKYGDKVIGEVELNKTATLHCQGMTMDSDIIVENIGEMPVIPEFNLQEKTITEGGEFSPDPGYDGFSKVVVIFPDLPPQPDPVLNAPEILLDDASLQIVDANNLSSFADIYINNEVAYTLDMTTSNVFDLTTLELESGVYPIYVKLRGEGYTTSEASQVVTYVVEQPIQTFTLTDSATGAVITVITPADYTFMGLINDENLNASGDFSFRQPNDPETSAILYKGYDIIQDENGEPNGLSIAAGAFSYTTAEERKLAAPTLTYTDDEIIVTDYSGLATGFNLRIRSVAPSSGENNTHSGGSGN